MRECVGLSVGATNLVAARADGSSTVRPAAVTWRGAVLTGFVERFGDPVPIVAADGSSHTADHLLVEALIRPASNARAASNGRAWRCQRTGPRDASTGCARCFPTRW